MVRSLSHSVCPFAIETTFPLSNFKTKHIFGIAPKAPFPRRAREIPPKAGVRESLIIEQDMHCTFFLRIKSRPCPNAHAQGACFKVNVCNIFNEFVHNFLLTFRFLCHAMKYFTFFVCFFMCFVEHCMFLE